MKIEADFKEIPKGTLYMKEKLMSGSLGEDSFEVFLTVPASKLLVTVGDQNYELSLVDVIQKFIETVIK